MAQHQSHWYRRSGDQTTRIGSHSYSFGDRTTNNHCQSNILGNWGANTD